MTRTLLIDADVVAYKAASSVERAFEWEPGYWTWACHMPDVQSAIETQIDWLMAELEAQDYRLCITDSEGNFRKKILPTYKGNRASVKKPLVLKAVREWLIEEKDAYFRPGLEGDDCMGILATVKHKDERVIVSIDKDMKTIPGLFCRNNDGNTDIVEISEHEADYWHLYQTLVGDTTDGYSGCPGCGPVKAEKIIGLPGDQLALGMDHQWAAVVAAYEKAKLTAHDALVQAQVARILRASDYDFSAKRPIPWTPSPARSVT